MIIIVKTEEEKQNLIQESLYIHNFAYVNRGSKKKKVKFIGLNSLKASALMHIYLNPDMIVVES